MKVEEILIRNYLQVCDKRTKRTTEPPKCRQNAVFVTFSVKRLSELVLEPETQRLCGEHYLREDVMITKRIQLANGNS